MPEPLAGKDNRRPPSRRDLHLNSRRNQVVEEIVEHRIDNAGIITDGALHLTREPNHATVPAGSTNGWEGWNRIPL